VLDIIYRRSQGSPTSAAHDVCGVRVMTLHSSRLRYF